MWPLRARRSSPLPFEGEVGVRDARLSHGGVWPCKYEAAPQESGGDFKSRVIVVQLSAPGQPDESQVTYAFCGAVRTGDPRLRQTCPLPSYQHKPPHTRDCVGWNRGEAEPDLDPGRGLLGCEPPWPPRTALSSRFTGSSTLLLKLENCCSRHHDSHPPIPQSSLSYGSN